ncbi:MAG: chemotaxis response regulator protein-glutamate methylesterase [Deltaproteobacteria bacterium]|nr:chemotaxis response regulator protein-glutamate methylesterase [Deltaproteobacteria bacterium]
MLRVLVVDDSVVYRKLMTELLSGIAGVVVVGAECNGRTALTRIEELAPDLVTLDIEMPGMDGLAVLEELRTRKLEVGVLMVSSHTVRGGELTIRALELGAFDFVTKPQHGALEDNRFSLAVSLQAIVKAFVAGHRIRGMLRKVAPRPPRSPSPPALTASAPALSLPPAARTPRQSHPPAWKVGLVLIGVSTGGPNALGRVIPALEAELDAPVVVVQHMPAVFTRSLAARLDAQSALRVKEAEDGEAIEPGSVYIAPGGRQLRVAMAAGRRQIRITDDPPEMNCKPSVDYLFRSVSLLPSHGVLGVIMTGMGSDGMLGCRLLKRAGAQIIAQDEASSVVFGMPRAAIDAGVVDKVCSLDSIAEEITRAVRGTRG